MAGQRVYISGPMAGYERLNEPAFRGAADAVLKAGDWPLVPHDIPARDHDGGCPASYASNDGQHTAACYLRADIAAMLDCDQVLMLPGWEASVGARLELSVAAAVGLPVAFATHSPSVGVSPEDTPSAASATGTGTTAATRRPREVM